MHLYKPPENNNPRAASAGANSRSKHRQSYQNQQNHQGKFNRAALPALAVVLRKLGMTLPNKVNHAGYFVLCCPFHNNGQEKHPSLNIHAISGFYKCHACGAHGRDALAFYMAVTGKRFSDAARDLGAWRVDS